MNEKLAGLFSNLGRGASGLFGGPVDPRLPPEQQAAARREALITAGLSAIIGSGPGSTGALPTLAQAALVGRQTGQQAQDRAVQQAGQGQIADLLAQGGVDLPSLRQALIQSARIGDSEGTKTLAAIITSMQAAQPDPTKLQSEKGINPDTGYEELLNFDPVRGTREFSGIRAVPGSPLVSLDQRTENSMSQSFGQFEGQRFSGAINTGITAQGDLNTYDEALRLVNTPGVYQGLGAQQVLQAKRLIQAMGGDPTGLDDTQALAALANQAALKMRNPESGYGLTGNTSDRDLSFLVNSVFNLGNSPQANRLIIEIAQAKAERQVVEGRAIQQYVAEHGGIDPGVYAAIDQAVKGLDFSDLRRRSEALQAQQPARNLFPDR